MQAPNILPLREQAEIVNSWLAHRLQHILPGLMRQAEVDMWILVGDEHHMSPLLRTLMPAYIRLFNNGRAILLFQLRGDDLECLALSRFDYGPIYQNAWVPRDEDQWSCLKRLVVERQPQRIAINRSETTPFAGDLTVGLHQQLLAALGPDLASRTTAADELAVNWLQLRSKPELAAYPEIIQIAKGLVGEIFSNRTVRVGQTTGKDLVWTFRQQVSDLGLQSWFQPFVTVWREGMKQSAIAPIIPGDMLHVDFGFEYLGLCTDHQQLAYVLREGESDAPDFLRQLMAAGNRVQDILLEETRPGRSGNGVLAKAGRRAAEEGIEMEVGSHPLGFHGHGAGPLIGRWGEQQGVPGRGDGLILENCCFALELAVTRSIPEWEGRVLRMGMEEDMIVGPKGASIIGDRQRSFLLIW